MSLTPEDLAFLKKIGQTPPAATEAPKPVSTKKDEE
jgi:hypothetical protein